MEELLMGAIAAFSGLSLLSYIFIVLHVPFMIIPTTLTALYLGIKFTIKNIKKVKFDLKSMLVIIVFVIGIAAQMAVIAPSGITKNGNILFWSSNGHDGMWHIALMEEMKKGWPFQNPIFAGEKLVNYHFFSDLLPAMVSKYTGVSNLDLYFRVFPLIYSIFFGVSAYFLTKKLSNNKSAPIWATIFTYFAGSFGYIVTYIKSKTIGGESIFWATQPQSASGNPPQIISDFMIMTAVYFYLLFREEKNKGKRKNMLFIVCVILFGTLVSFKVYAGVVALLALGFAGVWQFIKEKKIETLILAFVSGVLSIVLYFPNTSGSTAFLIFQPWWYIRTMVVEPSRLNWLDLELRRQFYVARGGIKSILRIIEYEGVAFLIFFFGNLGMRFLGLKEFFKTRPIVKFIIFLSLLLPMLFIQKGVASNTSQFLQYFVLFLGILTGIQFAEFPKKAKYFAAPIVILLMIPTQVGLLREFYSRPAFAKISAKEVDALNFVRKNTAENSSIVTPPYNQYLDLKDSTPNIWDWFDTSYVAAISSRRTYMDDYEQVDIMGYNWKDREKLKDDIFNSVDIEKVKSSFIATKANILYYPNAVSPKISPDKYGLTKIFDNGEVEVWKTN